MIDLIDLITIYECYNNIINEKIFPLSFIEKLKQNYKDINTMNSFMIKQRLQNNINYIKDINNINNKNKIYRVKYIINDIEKVRLKLINIINKNNNEKNNENKNKSITKNEKNNIKNNKDLKICYEEIKYCYFYYFEKIYNLEDNQQESLFISLEDKKLMIFDIVKIISFLLSEEENIILIIKDNIFNSVINILNSSITENNINKYKKYCIEQLFTILDKITENINLFNKYYSDNKDLFYNYILQEYSYINILFFDFKSIYNELSIFENLKAFDKKKIKVISKIISELTLIKNFLLKNISLINFNSVYNILITNNLDFIIVLII